MDFDQTCTDISLGHGQELIIFWKNVKCIDLRKSYIMPQGTFCQQDLRKEFTKFLFPLTKSKTRSEF